MSTADVEALRERNYNATITDFEFVHDQLWILKIAPDEGASEHKPGQYSNLALGYWEDRIDDAREPDLDAKWEKLVRRSYSISSRMLDGGELIPSPHDGKLEFYVVLVSPSDDNIPGLTPRLALKRPGDRIFVGRKMAGRYTLDPVDDPTSTLLMLSTGTGEAPHNVMVAELLRRGHTGPIVSAVCVRHRADLAYIDQHHELEARYPNYHYVPVMTREPGIPKRYFQDMIADGSLAEAAGVDFTPETTHVFLCGNPDMIGLPEETPDGPKYPERTGVVELFVKRGFTLDARKVPGNIHYEEFW